ncbi:N-acetylmuramoyl-L-alanine amidase CwlD [Fredinandcohnia sp. QZ13]|uniref:N-acetylmuramoyl-L-alanine amidase CwlD n=1 Tax=Fredinandcohnia sp. QZ13 TaxID=3073144 RepID=UPI0028537312|nr:N-acetylmuramoyl-L-alanine amidase CwlD [Fredinandcohnia sp. QZ13]MDR4888403.1 N-acetylmuramoyl-L-alanine amidase CwlD [Fredinandcohnia sp. QZ13]
MNKKLKITGILLGAVVLFIFIQYRFMDKDVWDPWSLPLSGKFIIIDPGHGGPDGGAESGDIQEKDIALEISYKLRDYLQQQGALVQMLREEDTDLAEDGTKGLSRRKTEDLKKRVQIINESDADLFISIHLNAIPAPRWRGAQTFYFSTFKENEEVAKFIQDELRNNLGNTTRQAKAINGVYLLKSAKKPGALVEVGFLSNPEEKALLIQDKYQDKVAASIYTGINRYFSNESNPPD